VSRKADFTTSEWAELKQTVELVGFGMLGISRSGPIGKVRELVALSSCLSPGAAPRQFSQNELVVALLEDTREEPIGPASYLFHRDLTGLIVAILIGRLYILTHCERTATLLAATSSQTEAEGLKQWLLWIARTVAEASGDGWLGMGRKVSDEEATMLNEVATALRMSVVATLPTPSELERMLGLAPPDAKGVSRSGGA
jgi:hypothetical protein